jgi:sigma-B regulation protein RsbU (phosphoserine phosphatase)
LELLISALEGPATRVELTQSPLSLGRSADNILAYPDDPWLSRFHLRFERDGANWWVHDCLSRNGTTVNSIAVKDPQQIHPGDRVCAGHLTIDVCDTRKPVQRPVISFVPENEERATREATIVTSLDQLLGKTGVSVKTNSPGSFTASLNTARVVGALLKAGQELAGHRPLEALFDVILNLSLSAVDAKRGVILTLEEKGDLVVRASKGDGFSISTAVRDRVINGRDAVVLSDAMVDDALRRQDSILMHQVRSMMAVPLQTGDRVIGLIYVDNGSIIRHFSHEDLDLLTVMANVAAIRIEHARLNEIEQNEKLMELELSQASEIQQTLLPPCAPPFEGFDLAGLNLCCRTVGGDYFDFLPYQDGRMGLVVGDVSGKGMPAALLMSSLQARVQKLKKNFSQSPQPLTAKFFATSYCLFRRQATFQPERIAMRNRTQRRAAEREAFKALRQSQRQRQNPSEPPMETIITNMNTNEAKNNSAQNATKHGCCSESILIMKSENPADFKALETTWFKAYNPKDNAETEMVHQLVEAKWYEKRCNRKLAEMETELMDSGSPFTWTEEQQKTLARFQRYATARTNAVIKATKALEDYRKNRTNEVVKSENTKSRNSRPSAKTKTKCPSKNASKKWKKSPNSAAWPKTSDQPIKKELVSDTILFSPLPAQPRL